MNFSDLPNGGHNLRLYTYDPVGSTYNQGQAGQWEYNSGHYDISLGVPCSLPDPKGFNSWGELSSYAGGRGETLVMVTRDDLTNLCAYRAPTQAVQGPIQTQVSATGGGITYQGGTTAATIVSTGGNGSSGGYVPGYIPSPGTPVANGGVPSGSTVGQTAPRGLSALYRFILYDPKNPDGAYSTGANYPGCSQANPGPCRAQAFKSLQDAIDYAEANGEIPYQVNSVTETWALVNGNADIDPKRILGKSAVGGFSIETLGLIALGLWFLSGR